MSASARVDGLSPEDGLSSHTMRVRVSDDIAIVDNHVLDDVVLDVTGNQAFVAPATAAAAARADDEVLDGFRDPVMPVVILGLISFLALVAIAAMLAL